MLTALRGAIGFLSRLPVGHDDRAWEAFAGRPVAFPIAGFLLGIVLALPLLLPGPSATVAFFFVVWIYAVTGINHLDGVADIGDSAVVHGGPEQRRAVLKDTTIGVGGVLAVAIVLLGLWTAAFGLAQLPEWWIDLGGPVLPEAIALVIVAEVGAKAAMALLVCFGTAPHEGLGSTFTERAGRRSALPILAVVGAVAFVSWPRIELSIAALVAAIGVSIAIGYWAKRNLGGVNGDVLGATNELARIAALHAGVVVWLLR